MFECLIRIQTLGTGAKMARHQINSADFLQQHAIFALRMCKIQNKNYKHTNLICLCIFCNNYL